MGDPTEKDLAARAGRGDGRALEILWKRHRERLLALVRRQLGASLRTKLESDDILQSAFLEALTDWSTSGEADATFLPWVARVLENKIRDRARYFGRARRATGLEAPPTSEVRDVPSTSTPTPSEVAQSREERQALRRALTRLGPKDRQLIELSRIEGRSVREIAEVLGKSEGATQRAIHRAVARLALLLAEETG